MFYIYTCICSMYLCHFVCKCRFMRAYKYSHMYTCKERTSHGCDRCDFQFQAGHFSCFGAVSFCGTA